MSSHLADLRRDYNLKGLSRADLAPDPFTQFGRWFEDALHAIGTDANAMTFSTVDPAGRPSSRVLLLKGLDPEKGFQFFTNYGSKKAKDLETNPQAAICFQWLPLDRQVCIAGTCTKCSEAESAAYFNSRPTGNRLAAWASRQSEVVPNRATMDCWLEDATRRFEGKEIPLPPFWGGYWLKPDEIEFWQGRAARFHDRLRYRRDGDVWIIERLSP